MNVAVVLAGGTGTRIGASVPKQFIQVMGKPILAYTLDNFQQDPEIDAIEVVCHRDWVEEVRRIVREYGYDKVRWLTMGGGTFQESTMNGIFHLKGTLAPEDILVLSFGVSPSCTPDIINDSIRVAKTHGNGISAQEAVLCTCIQDDPYSSTRSILRETIKGFSNPWSFRYGELVEAYEEGQRRGILKDLEPHTTSLYFALGKRIWFSKTNGHNFKVTTPEDLERFEGLLLLRQKRAREATETAGIGENGENGEKEGANHDQLQGI